MRKPATTGPRRKFGVAMLACCRPGTRVRVAVNLLSRPSPPPSSSVSTESDGVPRRQLDADETGRWPPHQALLSPPPRRAFWRLTANHFHDEVAEHDRIVRRRIKCDQAPRRSGRRSCPARWNQSGTRRGTNRRFCSGDSRLDSFVRYFASTSRPSESHVCLKHAPKDFDQSAAVYPDFVSTDESKALIKEANRRFGRKKRFQDGHWYVHLMATQ